jgi:hypothetical protein
MKGDSGRRGRSSRAPRPLGAGPAPGGGGGATAAAAAAATPLLVPMGAPHASQALRGTQSMPPARRMSGGPDGAGGCEGHITQSATP